MYLESKVTLIVINRVWLMSAFKEKLYKIHTMLRNLDIVIQRIVRYSIDHPLQTTYIENQMVETGLLQTIYHSYKSKNEPRPSLSCVWSI